MPLFYFRCLNKMRQQNSIICWLFACWQIWLYIRNNEHFWQSNQIDAPFCCSCVWHVLSYNAKQQTESRRYRSKRRNMNLHNFGDCQKSQSKPTACDSFCLKADTPDTHTSCTWEGSVCVSVSVCVVPHSLYLFLPSGLNFHPLLLSYGSAIPLLSL